MVVQKPIHSSREDPCYNQGRRNSGRAAGQ